MGHPTSSDNGLLSHKLLSKSDYFLHMKLPTHVHYLNMEFLSQPDLMLYEFVYNTMGAHGRENYNSN